MRGIEVDVPGELELADVVGVDLLQRAESMLVVGAAIGHPLGGIAIGAEQRRAASTAATGLAAGVGLADRRARTLRAAAHQERGEKTVGNDGYGGAAPLGVIP